MWLDILRWSIPVAVHGRGSSTPAPSTWSDWWPVCIWSPPEWGLTTAHSCLFPLGSWLLEVILVLKWGFREGTLTLPTQLWHTVESQTLSPGR